MLAVWLCAIGVPVSAVGGDSVTRDAERANMGRPRDLHRYEGRYLIDQYFDSASGDPNRHIRQFADVSADGDSLVLQERSRDNRDGDHPPGDRYALTHVSDHTFDAVGHALRLRFVPGDDGVAESLTVIRDGEPSGPGTRFVPLPDEIPDLRARFQPLELGHTRLCMTASNTEAVLSFYERLGFVRDTATPTVVRQGWTEIAFFDFQPQPCIHLWGPSILATGLELGRRGYALHHGYASTTHVQGDEAGGFFVYDPDGHRMFFFGNPSDRPIYDAWKNGTHEPDTGGPRERGEMAAPVDLPLGDLVVCLDVTDLDASLAWYRGMGFEVTDDTPASATVFSPPARENRYAFPIRLRQADEPRYSFGFLCDDVERVSDSIGARGIDIVPTPDGPAFVDPDGNCVRLLPARL